MDSYTRTDLASECLGGTARSLRGTEHLEEKIGPFSVYRTQIKTDEASAAIGKPKGFYWTVECGRVQAMTQEDRFLLVDLLAQEMRKMTERVCKKKVGTEFSVFVAGLGNAELTADAIGPQTVQRITATRHLKEHEGHLYREMGCAALSALAPGVLGQTGIETLELLRGAVRCVRPDAVLVIDALAARSCERLSRTVQLSDVGIAPGSGVGNHRAAITEETLGVPVITLGVPTVVNSATLVYDALHEAGIREMDAALEQVLETGKSFFVSPKESDVITREFSALLAEAISIAFLGELHGML